jgi:ribose transport system ATP-binding protein
MTLRLEMRGVRKRFGTTVALDGVDLEVAPGEVHALIGQNGAGKSTLMKILSGAHRPDEGAMALDGVPYRPRNPLEGRRMGVAMIYQELSLAPHLSVEENLVLGVEPAEGGILKRGRIREQALQALQEIDHPEIRPDQKVSSLSVAEQQIVEIGRALAVGCRVLVLDEPTSSITHRDAERLFRVIGRLRERGLGIVYISHFIEECKRVAGRFTVLRDGRSAGGGDLGGATAAQIIDLMVGQKVAELYPRSRRTPGEVLLSVEDLSGLEKPLGATFALRRGEVLGIAGLVGAGRTELLRAIFGLDPVRSGRVRLLAPRMGLVSEDRKGEGLFLNLPVAENMTLSTAGGPFVWPARIARGAARFIERLGIRCRGPEEPVGQLSGGNQQKVAIARLLHQDADVLLLDEPTRGIDVASKAQIYQMIDDLVARKEDPRAIVMVSSYLPELLGTCDRIAVMCRGRLGPARPAHELTEQGLVLEATGDAA